MNLQKALTKGIKNLAFSAARLSVNKSIILGVFKPIPSDAVIHWLDENKKGNSTDTK